MACQVSLDMWPLSSRPIMKPPRLYIEPYQLSNGRSFTSKLYGLKSIGADQLATAGRGLLKCRPLPPLLSRLTLFVMVIMVVDRYTNQWLIPSDYGAGLASLAYASQSLLPSTRLTSDNANSIAREEAPIRACPLDNSLDQLHRFWELWREGRTTYLPIPTGLPTPQEHEKTTSVNFTYAVQDVSLPAQRQYIITEYFQGEVNTDGGSGFRVDINSTAGLSKCSVVDHFNGNYSVCCPPTPMPQASPCGRTIFSIRLSFTRFFAYQTEGQTLPLLEPIYTEVEQGPCVDTDLRVHALRHSRGPAPVPSVPRCDRPFHLDDMHQGQWRIDPLAPPEAFSTSFNTSSDRMLYKWAVPRERPAPLEQEQTRETNDSSLALQRPLAANMQELCLYDRLADEEIYACLGMDGRGDVRSLYLIGDSHMRVLARYLAPYHNATFQGPWGQRNTEVSERFRFFWAGLGPEIGPAIVWNTVFTPTPNDRAMGPNDVIVFNNGAWDLWMAGPSNFANQTVPWIIDAARQLRGHPLWAKARVIYMTNYGYPLNNRHPGFRSEFAARAVDQALGPKLQELGVEVFDVLPLTDSRSAHVADDHHYINDEGHGEVGRELAHLLLRAMCRL